MRNALLVTVAALVMWLLMTAVSRADSWRMECVNGVCVWVRADLPKAATTPPSKTPVASVAVKATAVVQTREPRRSLLPSLRASVIRTRVTVSSVAYRVAHPFGGRFRCP